MSISSYLKSTIAGVPLSYFVYSSFSAFGAGRDGELPGMWFIRALTNAGRDTAVIRQTLYRMEQRGELSSRKIGRAKLYRASGYAEAEIEAGTEKIFTPARTDWDGQWTLVRLDLRAPAQETTRERVVALLAVHGCAHLGDNVFIHPRDIGGRLVEALSPAARERVMIFRGPLVNDEARPAIMARWQLPQLARRYQRVLTRLDTLEPIVAAGVSDRDAFLLRFGIVFDYLGVAWDDPELTTELLPPDWPGTVARRRTAALYTTLRRAATRHARTLLDATQPTSPTRS